jgi:CheY-like chemotaxis protein
MKPVLYAEDDADDLFFMRHVWQLAEVPNPLVHVKDGVQALEYLAGEGAFADRQKNPLPCLLLLDLKMPAKSGFEVLAWVRHHQTLAPLKVVIISASNQAADIAAAQSLGVTDYVVKSPDPEKLLCLVRQKRHLWLPISG